ncbi:MAG: hypothetical protein ACJ790_04060 [Myxococcaceae bacterium]
MPSAIPPPFVMLEPGQIDPGKQPRRPEEEDGRKVQPAQQSADKPTQVEPSRH